ncbi:ketoacyl-ACP synthase III family protein [Lysobacter sp. K5869]|uniref:ketoacyl-ACP synthase III family protein n=1 Tax=Lysobacter sp. K5869 TaxID=2820808 RepID=UPI001C060F03|nr:ketoacyl-ACP synthase III family protein [Lysobacter sp. K5869]QWP77573.1 ketoacyl-ACP synthase III family protein [Lysobacter sp. K5869]
MRPPCLYIAGLGACLPPALSAKEAVARGWYDAESYVVDGWTGACDAGDASPLRLALNAGRVALARGGRGSAGVDLLLHACVLPQGPHFWAPQAWLERQLIGRGVRAIELHQSCTGAFAGLELAAAWLMQDGERDVLLTCADNFGYDPGLGRDPTFRWRYARNRRTARGSVLGDAGAAALLSNRGGFAQVLSVVSRTLSPLEEAYRGDAPLFPAELGAEHPLRIGPRFEQYERRRPGGVSAALELINATRIELAKQALHEAGVGAQDIARVVHVFAGTERYVQQFLEPLGIDPARGLLEFGRELGHLGACDALVGLEHLVASGQLRGSDRVLMTANGASTAVACAVVEIQEAPRWVS